ncbi:hypothetical protein [Actinomadura harenae]|uniref:Uncharacterized protein n=1 Tax=Actinomadura harenae TaxID=2483351 RepID=A0A3M2M0A4_9ACTN|nr:hypothetical protein [Actinomadura harenae]RMI42916.1 hypothetical protein EBO15_17980 [Actinomadura harenae]
MTPDSWISWGRFLLVVAGALVVVSVGLVFTALDSDPFGAPGMGASLRLVHVIWFLGGLVAAVLAGAAFFSGLASFFWSATLRRHELLEEILRRLPD